MPDRLTGDITLDGAVVITGALSLDTPSITNAMIISTAAITRSRLAQDTVQAYVVPFTACRVWDDLAALVPGTAATDDLGIIEGTFGTDAPTVQTSDAKATTVTQRLRFLFQLPPEYDSAQTLECRIRGGMITTVSDTTATVDVECYEADGDGAVGADLSATAATTMNSLTKANVDFTVTATSLVAGDWLDVRVTVAITDAATATAVIGEISQIVMRLDIKG